MRVGLPVTIPDAAHYMLCRWVGRVCSSGSVEITNTTLVEAARADTNTWLEQAERSPDLGWKQREARRLYGQLALYFNAALDEDRRHGLVLRLDGGKGQPFAVVKEAGPVEAYTLYTPKDALMKRYAALDVLCAELGAPEQTMLYLPVAVANAASTEPDVVVKEEPLAPPAPAPIRAKKPAASGTTKKRAASTTAAAATATATQSPVKKAAPEVGLIEESSGETVK